MAIEPTSSFSKSWEITQEVGSAERQTLIQGWKQKVHEYRGGDETFNTRMIGWLADSHLHPDRCPYDHVLFYFPIPEEGFFPLLPADKVSSPYIDLHGKKLIVLAHFSGLPPLNKEQLEIHKKDMLDENRIKETDRDNYHYVSLRFPFNGIPAVDLIPILNP